MKKKFLIIISSLTIFLILLLSGCINEKKENQKIDVSIKIDNLNGLSPFTINFTTTSSNTNKKITSWNWNFGDGTTSDKKNPQHTFIYTDLKNSSKTYNVKLTITDEQKNEAKDNIQVIVYSNKRRLKPSIDTHIDYIDKYSNFGNLNHLKLIKSEKNISWPFLLFDLSTINLNPKWNISSVNLYLYCSNKSDGIYDISCSYSTGNDTFYDSLKEGFLSYDVFLKSNVTGFNFDTEEINVSGWHSWGLKNPENFLTKNNRLIFILLEEGLNNGDYILFNSKENTLNKPYIDVILSN